MKYQIKELTEEKANDILRWNYEEPYDFYNNELTNEALKELLDGSYYAVVNNEGKLIGFYCTGVSAQVPIGHESGAYIEDCIDFGLGMDPSLVGNGRGYEFCNLILARIREEHPSTPIRLTVASFNKRAIRLYKKLGFTYKKSFSMGEIEFITMTRNEVCNGC